MLNSSVFAKEYEEESDGRFHLSSPTRDDILVLVLHKILPNNIFLKHAKLHFS